VNGGIDGHGQGIALHAPDLTWLAIIGVLIGVVFLLRGSR
jgi:hypothetical protein